MIHRGVLVFDDEPDWPANELRVAGLSLLERGVLTLARAGISRILVVVPDGMLARPTRRLRALKVQVEYACWGSRPLADFASGEAFLLLRGDHVHHHTSLSGLVRDGLRGRDWVAQTADPGTVDHASTWVTATGRGLVLTADRPGPGTVASSGAFLCGAWLGEPGTGVHRATSLRELFSCLAEQRNGHLEGGARLWRRVTDRGSAREAKAMLFAVMGKATNGVVARALNTRLSIPLSKLLVETPVSPNLITIGLVLSTGLLAAYLVSDPGSYARLCWAGICWQLASILDGCDGEVARVKLCESSFGAWLDTVTDNLAYLALAAGMVAGMLRLHPESLLVRYAGLSAAASLVLALLLLYTYAGRNGQGSLQHYLPDMRRKVRPQDKDLGYRLVERFGFVTKRDFLSLAIALVFIAGQFEVAYWALALLLHLTALGVTSTLPRLMGEARVAAPEPASPGKVEWATSSLPPDEAP